MSLILRLCKSAVALAAVACMPVIAGTFTVSSVDIVMQARQPSYSLTIKNEAQAEALRVQVDSFSWNQSSGKDSYEATKDLVISPRVFTVPAGGVQVVRLALRNRQELKEELAYRLFVREVVDEKPFEVTGVKVALQLNIPVQVLPEKSSLKPLGLELTKNIAGQYEVVMTNNSNVRLKLTEVELINKSTGLAYESFPKALTILANTRRVFSIPELANSSTPTTTQLLLKGQGDGVVVDQLLQFAD